MSDVTPTEPVETAAPAAVGSGAPAEAAPATTAPVQGAPAAPQGAAAKPGATHGAAAKPGATHGAAAKPGATHGAAAKPGATHGAAAKPGAPHGAAAKPGAPAQAAAPASATATSAQEVLFEDAHKVRAKLEAAKVGGTEQSKALIEKFTTPMKEFDQAIANLPEAQRDTAHAEVLKFKTAADAVTAERTALEKLFKDGKYLDADGKTIEKPTAEVTQTVEGLKTKVSDAEKALADAKKNAADFFNKHGDEKVKTAFGNADKQATSMAKLPNQWTGRVKTEGVLGTLKHNFGFGEEGSFKNRKGAVFGRVALTSIGALAIAHGIGKSTNEEDGTKRSGLLRTGEVAAGILALGAGALAGKARIHA